MEVIGRCTYTTIGELLEDPTHPRAAEPVRFQGDGRRMQPSERREIADLFLKPQGAFWNGSKVPATDDARIREALHLQRLAPYHRRGDASVHDEVGVAGGRVDVLVITNQLHGFEIKSDVDSRSRLRGQVEHFSAYFHYMTAVVGLSHVAKVLEQVPPWWEVVVAYVDAGNIAFDVVREGQRNPATKLSIHHLLWKDEALAILKDLGIARGKAKLTAYRVCEAVREALPEPTLSQEVCERMRQRRGWAESTTMAMRRLVERQARETR